MERVTGVCVAIVASKDSSPSRRASGSPADAGLGLHSQNYGNGQGSFGGLVLQKRGTKDIEHGGKEPRWWELA